MVRVEDQDAVHGARVDRVDPIVLARHREHHVQEVLGVGQVVARIHERLTDAVLERHGREGRHLRDQPVRGDHALLRIVDIGGVVIEGGEGADHADHHRHRVGIAPEAPVEVVDLLVHHRVLGDGGDEAVLLRRIRQLAVEQQVGDLEKVAVRGQLVDGIAAVQKHALLAVDIGDLGLARAGRGKAGVVRELARAGIERADVDHRRAERALEHWQFDRTPALAIGEHGAGRIVALPGEACLARLRHPISLHVCPVPAAGRGAGS